MTKSIIRIMDFEKYQKQAQSELLEISNEDQLKNWKIKFLGRKSQLSQYLKTLSVLSQEEKRRQGLLANDLRKKLELAFDKKYQELIFRKKTESFDITQDGIEVELGHLNLLTHLEKEIIEIFKGLGFDIAIGPEIESEYYNFDALNIPSWHPARDEMDTFWLDLEKPSKNTKLYPANKKFLLRTHTSPVQIRYLKTHQPPFKMIVVDGKAYRNESTDARHDFQFTQVEGMMTGSDVSLANLKYVLEEFLSKFFETKVKTKFLPSYFPFVEPGLEVDVSCIGCFGKDKNCKVCGGSGWLEILGAGMVHPKVFKMAGYDPNKYQGFAFGIGYERLLMTKYQINDIRLFNSGDLRFIRQFKF